MPHGHRRGTVPVAERVLQPGRINVVHDLVDQISVVTPKAVAAAE